MVRSLVRLSAGFIGSMGWILEVECFVGPDLADRITGDQHVLELRTHVGNDLFMIFFSFDF